MSAADELVWTDEYSVGVPEIDDQHKLLFAMVGRLDVAIRERHGTAACTEILDELVDYTKVHFSEEEKLMRIAGFPELPGHHQHHAALVREVESLQEKVKGGKAAISFELMQFLRNWLTRHILKEDMVYAEYFRKIGFKGNAEWAKGAAAASEKPKKKWWKFW